MDERVALELGLLEHLEGIELRLGRGLTVSGVVRTPTEQPVAGAKVTARPVNRGGDANGPRIRRREAIWGDRWTTAWANCGNASAKSGY